MREFLLKNAEFFLREYHVDGFRYDQVSAIDESGRPNDWPFCQYLTNNLKTNYPSKINHAEYWPLQNLTVKNPPAGIGFSSSLSDTMRLTLRQVIAGSSWPGDQALDMTGLGRSLWPEGFESWQFV